MNIENAGDANTTNGNSTGVSLHNN